MGIPNQLLAWETCVWVEKQQLGTDMEQLIGSKLGKEYDKAVYFHSSYLIYMQGTSCKLLCWMNHKIHSSSIKISRRYISNLR